MNLDKKTTTTKQPVCVSVTSCSSVHIVKPFLGFFPTCSSLIPREKNLTRFQLVQPHVCKQLSNQKEPFPEEAGLLFWIKVWEVVFPCLVSLRATCSVGLYQINTSFLVNQAFDIFFLLQWPTVIWSFAKDPNEPTVQYKYGRLRLQKS